MKTAWEMKSAKITSYTLRQFLEYVYHVEELAKDDAGRIKPFTPSVERVFGTLQKGAEAKYRGSGSLSLEWRTKRESQGSGMRNNEKGGKMNDKVKDFLKSRPRATNREIIDGVPILGGQSGYVNAMILNGKTELAMQS